MKPHPATLAHVIAIMLLQPKFIDLAKHIQAIYYKPKYYICKICGHQLASESIPDLDQTIPCCSRLLHDLTMPAAL